MSNMKWIMKTKWLLVTVVLAILLFAPAVTAQTLACELLTENTLRDSHIRVHSDLLACGQRIALADKTICQIGFFLMKTGSPTGSVYARIRRASDNSIIQTSPTTFDVATIGTTYNWYYFEFNCYVNEEARILLEFVGSGDVNNYVRVGYQSTNVLEGCLTYNPPGYSENIDADTTIRMYAESAAPPSSPSEHVLTVASSPFAGVPVHIDGIAVGDTPTSRIVAEGEHVISTPQEIVVSTGTEAATGNINVGVDIYWGTTENQFLNNFRAKMQECNLKMVRLYFSPASMNTLRALVPAIVDNGIAVLGLLMRTEYAPDNVDAYGDWVYSIVSEFKSDVHVWEMWNEPNLDKFFSGKDPIKYTNFLKRGYTEAKRADPTCFVLGGSVVFTHRTARNFLEAIYQNGGKDYMDALSYHPYCHPYAPDDLSSPNPFVGLTDVRALMANYGDTRPIWITEVGWASAEIGETKQADYLVRALEIARDWGWIETFIIYNWKDSSTTGSATKGLLTTSYALKESFYAVKAWIEQNPQNGGNGGQTKTYTFVEWRDDYGNVLATDPAINLFVNRDIKITACMHQESEESPPPSPLEHWNLNIASTEGGTTSPSGTMEVLDGRAVSVAANADLEWKFSYWLFDGENVGDANPMTIPAQDADTSHTLVAVFAQLPLTQVMHVESIAMSKSDSRNVWCRAVVTIADSNGNPVAGATVEGIWSGLENGEQSEVTGTDGKVTFYSYRIRSHWRRSTVTFTVDNVVKTGWTYDPQANKETSDSIVI